MGRKKPNLLPEKHQEWASSWQSSPRPRPHTHQKTPHDLGLYLRFFLIFWSTKLPLEFSFKLFLQNLRAFLVHHFRFFYVSSTNKFQRPKNHIFRIITVTIPLLAPIYILLVFLVDTTKHEEGRICFGLKLKGSTAVWGSHRYRSVRLTATLHPQPRSREQRAVMLS